MGRTQTFYDLRDAMQEPGCAVCRLQAITSERFIEGLIYEKINDPGLRATLRLSRGFCREHAWLLDRSGASLGTAIIAHDVLKHVLADMERGEFVPVPALSLTRAQELLDHSRPKSATSGFVAALEPAAECPVCTRARETEEACFATLREHALEEGGLLADYRASDGFCLLHFKRMISGVSDAALFDALVEAQRAIWQRLVDELGEAIRKSDYRFYGELLSNEGHAWRRAIAALGGNRPGRGRD
jgi:hypothetical protein